MGLEIGIFENTTEGKKAATAEQISRQMTATVKSLMGQSKGIIDAIFSNPLGLTPQEVCDAMGTDAVKILAAGQSAEAMVNALRPNTMAIQIPKTADGKTQVPQPNEDGTVTILVVD